MEFWSWNWIYFYYLYNFENSEYQVRCLSLSLFKGPIPCFQNSATLNIFKFFFIVKLTVITPLFPLIKAVQISAGRH